MKRSIGKGMLCFALLAALGWGTGNTRLAAAETGGQAIATVDGQAVTEAEVQAAHAKEFQALERQYQQQRHDLLESRLKETVENRLLDAEAKAKGVSREKLLADAAKGSPVTDADVDKFYDEHKAQIPPTMTKEQVAPRIREVIEEQRRDEAREKLVAALAAKHAVAYRLEPIRVPVESAGFPAEGPTAAPVTIVEFSDFQCPYCSRLKPELEQVKARYGDKVRIVFRQFPLPMHENAPKAAEASLCANDQGKFWPMHDAMFGDQEGLAPEGLKAKAKSIGLNEPAFSACLDGDRHAKEIEADVAAGQEAGVQGTPAMFVNGRFLNGAVPLEEITRVVDDELKRPAGGKGAAK